MTGQTVWLQLNLALPHSSPVSWFNNKISFLWPWFNSCMTCFLCDVIFLWKVTNVNLSRGFPFLSQRLYFWWKSPGTCLVLIQVWTITWPSWAAAWTLLLEYWAPEGPRHLSTTDSDAELEAGTAMMGLPQVAKDWTLEAKQRQGTTTPVNTAETWLHSRVWSQIHKTHGSFKWTDTALNQLFANQFLCLLHQSLDLSMKKGKGKKRKRQKN